MLSIGWIMFFKSLVLGLWAGVETAWASWKERRAARGIPLKQDKRGVYVPSQWPEKLERFLYLAKETIVWIGVANAVFWIGVLIYMKAFT